MLFRSRSHARLPTSRLIRRFLGGRVRTIALTRFDEDSPVEENEADLEDAIDGWRS